MKRILIVVLLAGLLVGLGPASSPAEAIRCRRGATTCWRHERRPGKVRRCWVSWSVGRCRPSAPVMLIPL